MDKQRKFETCGRIISIPLNYKGYIVEANVSKVENSSDFNITYAIGHVDSSYIDRIEGDMFTIHSEKNVNWDVYNFTMRKFTDGYFKHFIDRYDYEMTGMIKGVELLDAEKGL